MKHLGHYIFHNTLGEVSELLWSQCVNCRLTHTDQPQHEKHLMEQVV